MNMKSKLLNVLCVACCMVFMQQVIAQNTITITGRVISSEDRASLPGVSVKLKGSSAAAQTNINGDYTIKVPNSNSVLVFTYMGFVAQEKEVSSSRVVNVTLRPQNNDLNEVVIIGYGQSSRKDLTGSVGSVKMGEVGKAPVRSFEEALAGRVAGVSASSDDGQPGASVNIVIRGNNSLTQDNSPLYVIDGFPIENPDNNALNPAEIESIEVLKDASSTAIYGARGANGVIVITTRKGKEGSPVISYNGFYGYSQNSRKMELMDGYEYIRYQFERDSANVSNIYFTEGRSLEDFRGQRGIDLQDSLFGSNPFQNHTLSLSGGNKGTRYSISGSALNQDGIMVNSGYDRYQGRLSLDQTVNSRLKVGLNTNYSNLKQYGTSPSLGGNGFYYGNLLYSVWAFRPVSGRLAEVDEDLDSGDEDFLVLQGFNPIKTARNELRQRLSDVLTVNAYGEYRLGEDFKLRVSGGLSRTKGRSETFDNTQTPRGSPLTKSGQDYGVSGSVLYTELNSWLNENTLSYNKTFNSSHHLDALAGFTLQSSKRLGYGFAANHLPNEALGLSGLDEGQPVSVNSTSSVYTLASFLGRINYTYRSKYLFTGSFRTDGSSKFARQNRWSYFPSGAVAWRISEEAFMKALRFVSNAKLRLSYGATGNNRVDDFAYLSRITLPASTGYSYNNQPVKAAGLSELGNVNLKWETTHQTDVGFDLGLFNQRISLETDLYRKVTSDLLLDAAVPGSIGFSTAIRNIGKVQNQGIEVTLNTVNVKGKRFSWASNFNISFNRNKVLALSDNESSRLTTASWNTATTNIPLYIAEVGHPIARFYGFKWEGNYQYSDFDETSPGVYSLKADVPGYTQTRPIQPGDIKYKDVNGDGHVDGDDVTIIGNPNPDFFGGFSNNISYGHFDLNVFFQYSVGNDLINANRIIFEGGGQVNQNMFATYENRWTPTNPNNEYYRTGGGGPATFTYSSRVIEDGSYLKLKTVQLGYNVPSKISSRMKLKSARVYISGQNLFTWTSYQGFDPEVSKFGSSALRPGFDYSVYPNSRTLTFGLNVSL
ncbi:TonB-dependent receptor [Arcticibacter tournemirensis]|uniref:TonB-dependent receptor n=2 Tax=Arcticibacter tournemirensis TaxID=699437 RepID=A0A4Q0MBC4_9SPHI|nr:TonB-dependent receptor [Arcticibacter tournemirensis]